MHDDHDHDAEHGGGASNPWADRVNEAYYDGMGAAFGQKTRERINWMCSQVQGSSVLDVGCSQGIASILMAREGLRVTGLDIYPPAIEYAMGERAKEIETVQQRLDFRCGELSTIGDDVFDTVVMGEVVEHQTNPQRFIRQGAARVAPGGRLIVTVPFGLNPWPDHKSTVFPRDLHDAIADAFAMVSLEVTDGYIRIVADRRRAGEAAQDHTRVLLQETEKGARDSQVNYYAVSATSQQHAKAKAALEVDGRVYRERLAKLTARVAELEREVAVASERASGQQAALEAAQQAAANLAAQQAEMLRVTREASDASRAEQAELLKASRDDLADARKAQTDLADLHARRLEEVLQQAVNLQAELALARNEEHAAAARVRALEADLLARQSDLVAMRETDGARVRAANELDARLKKMTAELKDAQEKRSAHWAKLEAERARAQQLIELATRLHEENQRFDQSIALGIGRAMLGLGSVRGIIGFPRAMARVVRQFQRRRNGTLPIVPLQLPPLKSVVVTKPAIPAEPATAAAQAVDEAAKRRAEDQKKKLTVVGWEQEDLSGRLPVMSVLDEFSRACFAPHANLIEARPDNWEGLFEKFAPRFLLAESAWRGNRGTWRYRVADTEHPPGDEFAQMTEAFRKRGVPTVFWNKEDPVHFDAFLLAAGRCDVILTTSAESVDRYREKTQARIEVMQFGAEDSLHNPQGSSQRNGRVCFAGSYYAEGFEARQGEQAMLLEAAKGFGLDIYDRNHRTVGARSEFAFPEEYAPFIRGRLDFETLSRKYREYQVFLNVNSVSDSATMFSRRVFELLACGTPVVSTWSRGIEDMFGDDLVWQVRDQAEATEALRVLTTDAAEWRRRSLAGIRAVLSRHTFRHRFANVLSLVGERTPDPVHVVAIAEVAKQTDADLALAAFRRQQTADDIRTQLLLVCRDGFLLEGTWPDSRVLPDTNVPLAQLIDWEHESSPGAVVAVFSPRAVYGRHYLLDAVIAVRYSRAHVVGKAVDGAEYEWGGALDPRSLVVNMHALDAANAKAVDLFDAKGGFAPVFAAKVYAADSANFAVADAGADRDELLPKIEV